MFKRGDIANNLFLICFTHMECILCGWGRIGYSDVSIHAPARGATKFQTGMFYASVVSIHAPTRGATKRQGNHRNAHGFQSTHPHGVRHPEHVSPSLGVCFNPRTHTGCDNYLYNYLRPLFCFNPRTHTGCDL